jgi:hypothetical protein
MRRVLATVVLVLSAVVGLPATAHAGGPTSVLITHVGASAGALYYTDDAYYALVALLPDAETKGGAQPPGGIDYNLTWMIHDVSAWRYDHVRVTRDGTAWVSTSFTNDDAAGWQEVVPSAKLVEILEAVQSDTAVDTVSLVPDAEPASTPPAVTPTDEADPAWFSLSGWRWVVPGGLLGLLVGTVAARRRRDEEPRRVLISSGA